jgi:hypothetical protein
MFTTIGASDIAKHEEHHKKFKVAISKVGFGQLVLSAEKYIALNGDSSQIVYFLSGHYYQYIEGDKQPTRKKKVAQVSKLPKSLQKQEEAKQNVQAQMEQTQGETAVTIEPDMTPEQLQGTIEDIHATMALLRGTEKQVLGQS